MIRLNGVLRTDASLSGSVTISGTVTTTPVPATSGGTNTYHRVSTADNNAHVVKASAGQYYGMRGNSIAAYPVYLKFYDKATNPNPASDTPIRIVEIQAGLPINDLVEFGLPFTTGIAMAIVKGISDTNNTSVLASDCSVEIDYA